MKKKTIVYIIDDDPSALRGLGRLLKAHGCDPRCFASARELLAADMPDADSCLLIDVAMPEMDGFQLHAELRRRGCRAPAVFITALDDPAVRESATRLGAGAFFHKPVDGNELMAAIRRTMAQRTGAGHGHTQRRNRARSRPP